MLCAFFTPIPHKEHDLIVQSQGEKCPIDHPDSSLHDKNNGSVEHQTLVSKDEFSDICNSVPINERLEGYICSHAVLT